MSEESPSVYRTRICGIVLIALLAACAADTVLLNSERIEQQFGNYGIEVLASEDDLRRSNLYSGHGDDRLCRTYAVVRYPDDPDAIYKEEHAGIMAGGSLGEVFKDNGWAVLKTTQHIGELNIGSGDSAVRTLMQLGDRQQLLAVHAYQLSVQKSGRTYRYATIIEAHHPDYLTERDLLKIYPVDDSAALSGAALSELLNLVMDSHFE